VLEQLLGRGVKVRAIVRSKARIPGRLAAAPNLELVEADVLSVPDAELARLLRDRDAVVSCLGHNLSLAGILGPPRDLVTRATARVCRAAKAAEPATPIRFVLMSSVSVNRPARADTRRGPFERAFLALLRAVVPPAKDNQRAADFLCRAVGSSDRWLRWVAVRPDALVEGDVSEYALHDGLVDGLFKPGRTRMANVAHFMCELVTDRRVWSEWEGKMPVVVDARPRP
jgi:nucleoside-diphosphate-sugar epimerase